MKLNKLILSACVLSRLTLCHPTDCSPPGSSVHGDSPVKNTGVVINLAGNRTYFYTSSHQSLWTRLEHKVRKRIDHSCETMVISVKC